MSDDEFCVICEEEAEIVESGMCGNCFHKKTGE